MDKMNYKSISNCFSKSESLNTHIANSSSNLASQTRYSLQQTLY